MRLEVHTIQGVRSADCGLLGIAGVVAAFKASAHLMCRAVSQLSTDLQARKARETKCQTFERQSAERRLLQALAKIDLLQGQLEETEAALLSSRAEAERLRASVPRAVPEVTTLALLPGHPAGGTAAHQADQGGRWNGCTMPELVRWIDDLSEQLEVVTEERDAARMNEEELFSALVTADEDAKAGRLNLVALASRVQTREAQLLQAYHRLDPNWVISQLDASEELLFSGVFYHYTSGCSTAPLDNEGLQAFILANTTISRMDIDAGLPGIPVLDASFRMDVQGFLRLLRERPARDEDALRHFEELAKHYNSRHKEELSPEACRQGVLGVLCSLCGNRLPKDRMERAADVVMHDAGNAISLEQWLAYWKQSCRIGRLWRLAEARGLRLPDEG